MIFKRKNAKERTYGVGVGMKSMRQFKADLLRAKNHNWRYGVWTPYNMSNRQVLKKFSKKGGNK